MDTADLLDLTFTLTMTTILLGGTAGLLPRLVGEEPNLLVGIRTKATTSSPEAWRLAHRVARPLLRRTMWTAVVGLLVQVAAGAVAGFGSMVSVVAAALTCVATFVVLIAAAVRGHTAARDLRDSS